MNFHIVTLFPDFIKKYLELGVISKAIEKGLFSVKVYNPRDYATDKRKTVDGKIYGGGKGMLLLAPLLHKVVVDIKQNYPDSKVIYLTPQGKVFNNTVARQLAGEENLILISGRYEGVDARFVEIDVDEELSIGDYVLTGGEVASLVVMDAISRFAGGMLESKAIAEESFESGLLEHEHYTEPDEWQGLKVPPVLKSGDHKKVSDYRLYSSLRKTYFNRIDLLLDYKLTFADEGGIETDVKKIKKHNVRLKNFLSNIQQIAKEWKDVRRDSKSE